MGWRYLYLRETADADFDALEDDEDVLGDDIPDYLG